MSFPKSYEDAQNQMRDVMADTFSTMILEKKEYLEEIKLEKDLSSITKEKLRDVIRGNEKNGFLKFRTPPFLIKNIGLAKEFFIHYKIASENKGYIIPTLLYQRVFKGLYKALTDEEYKIILSAVPDFLYIKGGRVRGVELGRERSFYGTGKASVISGFAGACGIPTSEVNVHIGNPSIDRWFDFGMKCNRCYRSFRLCKEFIKRESGDKESFYKMDKKDLICENFCDETKIVKCKDAVLFTQVMNYSTNRLNQKLVHYLCLGDDDVKDNATPVPLLPIIDGFDVIEEGLR